MRLTAALIVKNEDANIRRCLDSLLPVVDEIVIVDTGSTDETLLHLTNYRHAYPDQIRWRKSANFNADTELLDFHFGQARNEALAMVRDGWVLSIDADETVAVDDPDALRDLLNSTDKPAFPVLIKFMTARKMFYGNRLFRKTANVKWGRRVHESLYVTTPDGDDAPLNFPVASEDWMQSDLLVLEHHTDKQSFERNIQLLEKQADEEGRVTRTWAELGFEYNDAGHKIKAAGLFEMYLHSKPDDLVAEAHVLNSLGWIYLQYGVVLAVLEYGKRLIGLMPLSRKGYILVAEAYLRVQRYTVALYYLRAAAKMPGDLSLLITQPLDEELSGIHARIKEVEELEQHPPPVAA